MDKIKMADVFELPVFVEYGNDTGPNDGYFIEWWSIVEGEHLSEKQAEFAVHAINNHDRLTARVEELEGQLANAKAEGVREMRGGDAVAFKKELAYPKWDKLEGVKDE